MSFPARLLQIELEFDLRSAFRISLGHPIGADDHPLARNDRGEADLTPDGLVGAMHTALTRLLDDVTIDGIEGVTVLDDLFGAAVDHDEDLGTPSRLRIVELSRKGREPIELTEDRVALHRGFGAARDERKFDAQIAVARSPWQVGLHLDLDDREDAANSSAQSVAALTLLLREWGQVNEDPTWLAAPGVGGGAGVGLGQFAVRIGPTSQVDLHNRDHLAHWLRRRTSAGLRRDDTGSLLGDAVSLPD